MFKFLRDDSSISTTRVTYFMAVIASLFLIVIIGINITYRTIICDVVNWSELAIFMSAITAFNTPFIFGKVSQKKIELQEDLDDKDKEMKTPRNV